MDTIKTDQTRNVHNDLDLEPFFERLDEDRYAAAEFGSHGPLQKMLVETPNHMGIDDRTALLAELIRERAAHRAADERTKEYLASLVVVVAVAGITVVGALTGWW